MLGERLARLVSFEALKLAAGAVLLSPYIPLIFMGEEYGEESPFLYFVSHSDPDLIAAVREGRKSEFQDFKWEGVPPDPQSPETFLRSRLRWEKRREGRHKVLFEFYRRLIQLRKGIPALSNPDRNNIEVSGMEKIILLRRWCDESHVFCIMNFHEENIIFHAHLPNGRWKKILDSSDEMWGGSGSSLPGMIEKEQELTIRPLGFALYEAYT
jgi:maltooligosyltrehalose trehalohydrolase